LQRSIWQIESKAASDLAAALLHSFCLFIYFVLVAVVAVALASLVALPKNYKKNQKIEEVKRYPQLQIDSHSVSASVSVPVPGLLCAP